MIQKETAKHTLIAIAVAATWILLLHGAIVIWAMTEPARIERMEEAYAAGNNPPAAPAPNPAPSPSIAAPSNAAQAAPAPGAPRPVTSVRRTMGWAHVAFPAVLIASCVAIFASLVWAAVALNREYD